MTHNYKTMTAAFRIMKEKMKNTRLVYAAYWLGFILFILVFVFNEYQQEFIRAILFLAGFLYAKHFAEKRAKYYIENYKLPGAPYEPGKFLDYKQYRKAFPGLARLIIITVIGIAIGSWGLDAGFDLFIYLGPLITGIGIGELAAHIKVKKEIKKKLNNLTI